MSTTHNDDYPKHNLEQALRIPRLILEQNAGRPCSREEAAAFAGVALAGRFVTEITSSKRFGLLEENGELTISGRARAILRPESRQADMSARRDAIRAAPVVGDIYDFYKSENLPDDQFFRNALTERFGIREAKVSAVTKVLMQSLEFAGLLEEHEGHIRVLDPSGGGERDAEVTADRERASGEDLHDEEDERSTCFVVQPFAEPYGGYFSLIYEPAIEGAGLQAMRADAEIFGTGKIMDQIFAGIREADVLVAELTTRNPNVLYELGLAHALRKPVVLVSSNEDDVPFDLSHIRVIYYDNNDPFWGEKLKGKITDHLKLALEDPNEIIFDPTSPG